MSIFEDLFLLQRIDHLIRTRGTGTPAQLAERLEICERHTYRLIGQLKDSGFPIAYDKTRGSYYYIHDVQLHLDIRVNGQKLIGISSGEKNNFFKD